MGLTGACSNQATGRALAEANRARVRLVALPGRSAPKPKVAQRPMPATEIIAEVLRASDEPLGIADVLERVEQILGRSVRRASLKAALAEMAASDASPVRRVSRGRYESSDRPTEP